MGDEPRMTLQTAAVLSAFLDQPLEPRYGLEISKEAGLPSGTLYPILARLEQAGWVESYWEDIDQSVEQRRRRRYYKLTTNGAAQARIALDRARRKLVPGWLPGPRGAQA
jgi:PadR family transcriptional regulator PadR